MSSWETEAEALLSSGARHILLLSRADSARGQIAEAIARALAPPQVHVTSAGLTRSRVDPMAARVLAELSVNVADQRSKSLDEVDLSDVQAVITLADGVNVPPALREAMHVHWPLPDPAATKGSDEERLGAYRRLRNELRRRLLKVFARDARVVAAGSGPTTTIEPASGGDLEDVRAILSAALLPSKQVGRRNQRFIVAREMGRIIGCAGLEVYGDLGQARSVAVDWTRRNAGLGTRLHERLLHEALAAGVRTLYVVTSTAQDFFGQHGYTPVKAESLPAPVRQSEEFCTLGTADAVAMSRAVRAS